MAAAPVRNVLLATSGLHCGGGIASVSRCMLRALEEEAEAGHLHGVDALSLIDRFSSRNGRFGVQRSARGSKSRFALQAWLLMRRSPDLVLLDHLGLGRAFHLPIPAIAPRRMAIFVHGTEFWAIEGGTRESVVRGAERILTNSEFTARSVRERMPDIADRVSTVLLCIDPELTKEWERLEKGLRPAERELAVLIVGRMDENEPGKGHDALLDAWSAVRRAVPEAVLWIAGDGDLRDRLEEQSSRLEPGSVEFLGRVSNEELSRLYRRAALFAMPSRQEGFGLVYAEAMWHGLPCVASTADAGQEVVRDGVTGALVPFGEPRCLAKTLITLLTNPERRREMGERAVREARDRFGYERFRRDFLSALELTPVTGGGGRRLDGSVPSRTTE